MTYRAWVCVLGTIALAAWSASCGGGAMPPACTPALCDDGNPCTQDACRDDGTCTHTPMDALCPDDGVSCTTARCDAMRGCVHEADDAACDDGIACTIDRCGVAGCMHVADDSACDDGVTCTRDSCGGVAGCIHAPDDTLCGSGQLCRVDRGCTDPPRCSSPSDPRCDDGVPCTTDRCDLATGRCVYEADASMCDDGVFCNGEHACAPFRGCVLVSVPSCDDGIPCTIDQCNEEMRRCESIPERRLCDDGVFCNGAERCDPSAGGCVEGTAPSCDDGDACTVDVCDPRMDRCRSTIVDADGDGDGAASCGGGDCDDADSSRSSLTAEVCDGVDQDCDGRVDETVLGPCGTCDPTCRRTERLGADFSGSGAIGAEYDPGRGGLVISTEVRESNFLWVPNTAESTLSKWDASTGRELARYRVGLPAGECPGRCCWESGCNMPSRVAVDGRGDVYVANRGFGMQGTVTKIAADIRDCVDRNGNGRIDTATTALPLPYGQDECVLWTAPVGPVDAVLRALAIDRGDAANPQGYPWVGGYNNSTFYRLDPRTGAVTRTVAVPGVNPYGAVVLADGRLWVGTLGNGATGFFDTADALPRFTRVDYPLGMRGGCGQSYGITADARGRVWFSGWGCNDALGLDTRSGQWTRVDTTPFGMTAGRGITVDARGRVWMALGGDGASNLVSWDSDGFVPGGTIGGPIALRHLTLPSGHVGPSGVGADRDGNIWVAHWITSQLVRVDPATGAMTSYTGPSRVYTYSDFTGSVRRAVIGRGSFTEDVDAGCDAPVWGELAWDVSTPASTSVEFSAGSSATAAGLDAATTVTVATTPPDTSPRSTGAALTRAGIAHGRFLRLTTTLNGSGTSSPVVRGYTLSWRCP
jgi:streptogramin lyase